MRVFSSFILFLGIFILANTVFAADYDILLNEILIDSSPQLVELINRGEESIDISNWYIDDSGGATFFTIPENSILPPNSCSVFSSDFNFNKTSSDVVRLFSPTAPPTSTQAGLIDMFLYEKAPGSEISYLRLPDGEDNWTSASATLGKFNQTGLACFIEPTRTPTPTPKRTILPTSPPTPSQTPAVFQKNQDILSSPLPQLTLIPFNVSLPHRASSSQEEVLGELTAPPDTKAVQLTKTLSFISASYSVLTITSVFFKMKFGVQPN